MPVVGVIHVWILAAFAALLGGSGLFIWLDEQGVPLAVAAPLGTVAGLTIGALGLAYGGAL